MKQGCLTVPAPAACHTHPPAEECDYIIKLAGPRLTRSGVVSNEKTGSTEINDVRTSYGAFLERGEDDVVKGAQEACRYVQPWLR
jgi:prolyl 4-hydroxylase